MLLGFKRRFEPMVVDGSKRHTIRVKGGRKWRPGVICDCYVDSRQKTMRLLGRWPCTRVEDISIRKTCREDCQPEFLDEIEVRIAGVVLDRAERNAFAWRDGFRDNGEHGAFALMMSFWMEEHDVCNKPFEGDLIHWDYDNKKPVPVRVKRVKAAA